MNTVTVIPIAKGMQKEHLTYFTAKNIPVGALVTVPLRKREISALVIDTEPVSKSKSQIKSSDFSIRKVIDVTSNSFFLPEFITAAERSAEYFVTSTGAVIQAMFPTALLEDASLFEFDTQETKTRADTGEKFILQSEQKERIATYKSLIREEFAKQSSVYFCLPTILDIEEMYSGLERGIQDYTFIFHSNLTKKQLRERWKAALAKEHPVLIIGTGSFLSIPRRDIKTLIVDNESSSAYKTQSRPFIDIRQFAETLAEEMNWRLVFGDTFLRPETYYRSEETHELLEFNRPKYRILSSAKQEVVDIKKEEDQPATGSVRLLTTELIDLIKYSKKHNEHMFILGVRRGFAPLTICGDCGNVVYCESCNAPIVLHQKNTDQKEDSARFYMCHRCGSKKDATMTCTHCKSWRLIPLGIGTEQALDIIVKHMPDLKIFRLDRDSVSTHKKAKELIEEFYDTPGSLLIGTEMAIPYLTQPIENSAVLSVNSLLTIPDFRINEKIFRLLLALRIRTTSRFLIQTRETEEGFFDLVTQGNVLGFYRSEIEDRKLFNYPPFSTIIKITHEGKKGEGQKIIDELALRLTDYEIATFPAFISKVKNKYRTHMIIKLPREEWVDSKLLAILRALPPSLSIKVDPDTVL